MSSTRNESLGTAARLLAAAAILVGGLVHLQLYFDGYRHLPDANLGRSFIANSVVSVIVAAALVWSRDAIVRLAGIAVALATLVFFALSRMGSGVLGLRETGLEPSPQALIALAAEVLAVLLLAASFLPALGAGGALPRSSRLLAAGGFAVITIALGVMWANVADRSPTAASADSAPAAAGAASDVTIVDFSFQAPEISVAVGTTINWTNADSAAHSVVATDRSFESERLATDESFTFTFDAPGTFTYNCGLHPSMAGTVVVAG